MAAITETDMSRFEDALDADYCHLGPEGNAKCFCGHVSQSFATAEHYADWRRERCSGCGRLNCPRCQAIARQVGY
jgi:hypothetical protein